MIVVDETRTKTIASDNENGKYNRFENIIFSVGRSLRSDGQASRFRTVSLRTPVSQRTGSRRYGKPILPHVHLSFHFQACIRRSGTMGVRHFPPPESRFDRKYGDDCNALSSQEALQSLTDRISLQELSILGSGRRYVLGINSLDDFWGRNIRTRN